MSSKKRLPHFPDAIPQPATHGPRGMGHGFAEREPSRKTTIQIQDEWIMEVVDDDVPPPPPA